METENLQASELIAPCGINCGVCLGYLREKNKCQGCRSKGIQKPHHCFVCTIINCEYLLESNLTFCYECKKYPCSRIKQLDKRYREKYNMSIISNMFLIKETSLEHFVDTEKVKWMCHKCGGTICVHRGFCLHCEKRRS